MKIKEFMEMKGIDRIWLKVDDLNKIDEYFIENDCAHASKSHTAGIVKSEQYWSKYVETDYVEISSTYNDDHDCGFYFRGEQHIKGERVYTLDEIIGNGLSFTSERDIVDYAIENNVIITTKNYDEFSCLVKLIERNGCFYGCFYNRGELSDEERVYRVYNEFYYNGVRIDYKLEYWYCNDDIFLGTKRMMFEELYEAIE